MTILDNIQHTIAPELRQLNTRMVDTLSTSNEMMNEIVGNYLKTKGKQIRPILVILSAKLLGDVNEVTISAAAAIEMLHNASLIHDDVVDDTHTRRNRPTINAIWDNHIAVLTGDFFTSCSLRQAVAANDLRIINTIADLGRTLSLGEIDQISKARRHILDEKAYLNIIGKKTASLFVACTKMGGYSVNASCSDIDRLGRFAWLFGQCFQIRDDVFDYFPSELVGKPTGNDLREGKISLPLLHALDGPESPERNHIIELLAKDSLTDEEIAEIQDFARNNGGIEYAFAEMRRLRDEATKRGNGMQTLLWICLATLMAACASMGRPEGGAKDEIPPEYVSSNPAPGAKNVNKTRITVTFNENIQLEDAFTKVIVSPPQKTPPRITSNGRHVTADIQDTLIPSTTYTIDFADAIKDLNEGNVLDGFALDFSTGDSIDSLRISGMVLQAENLEPAQGMLVGVYRDYTDTSLTTLPFDRIARTNQLGQFTIRSNRATIIFSQ